MAAPPIYFVPLLTSNPARNVLLLTLIADKIPVPTIWNIFYHMYLDAGSHSILLAQCKKLIDASDSMESWRASPYAAFLRYSTEYSLVELRRHWSLWVAMPDFPSKRKKAIRQAFEKVFKTFGLEKWAQPGISTARSAGPLVASAAGPASAQIKNYWKTGTTFFQQKDVAAAKLVNPTFAYSLAGEGCALHYGTDPMMGFHFAALFGNANGRVAAADMVRTAKEEFYAWCAAFYRVVSDAARAPPRLCFFLAEATAACRALSAFSATGTLNLGVPVAQFRTQLIRLDKSEYAEGSVKASFNVVETSNLVDYVGLLHILVAASPLMASSPFSVLYTESLLFRGEDATKEFAQALYGHIGTMGLLLDLCPIDYLCGFTTRSNTHEIMMYDETSKKEPVVTQYHQVTTWKSPTLCDSSVASHGSQPCLPPVFDARQLGTFLFDVYHAMFEQEDTPIFVAQNERNMHRALAWANKIDYMRESFVLLLKRIRERCRLSPAPWRDVMDRFFEHEQGDMTMPMNTVNRNDLYAHLHKHGVYTVAYYTWPPEKIGPFAGWEIVPPVVRIVLSVPREKITAFERILDECGVGTPLLECDVMGAMSHNIFVGIHVAYGRAISVGSKSDPRLIFEEDPEGPRGSSSLVVSFLLSARLLTDVEPPGNLRVRFRVRWTPGIDSAKLRSKLGFFLEIFGANLLDEEHVHVLPEAALPAVDYADSSAVNPIFSPNATHRVQVGRQNAVEVELDEQCELVGSLITRVDIEDEDVIRDFGSGAMPEIVQTSPCVTRLTVAGHVQDVTFPFPVVGSEFKLRLARKSRYMEVRYKAVYLFWSSMSAEY